MTGATGMPAFWNARMLDLFAEFCRLKIGVNGPDIHMKAAGAGTADAGPSRPWRLIVYNNFCSTPPAAVIWSRFQTHEHVLQNPEALEKWIAANWKGIPIRQNRRPARSVPKLTRSFVTAAEWYRSEYPRLGEMSYVEAWKSLDSVYTWGRYVKIKFLETARAYLGHTHLESPTIQSAGGWSPRKALALLAPGGTGILTSKSDSKDTLAYVHSIAEEVRQYVIAKNDAPLSNYQLEALLCNFRQTLSTRKTFYVGRTIDSELEYDGKVREWFSGPGINPDPYGGQFDFFGARRAAFPIECLGEVQGWDGVRPILSDVLRLHGYVWSDTLYDYMATTDFANPVKR